MSNVTSVANLARSVLQGTPAVIHVNECDRSFHAGYNPAAHYSKVPDAIDVISIDMYAGAGEASASQAFYREYILPRMADHQRIILVPGLYGDRNVSRTGSMASQEAAVLHKLETFWAWARDDRRVVGLVPWHWQSASLGAFGLGSSIVGTDVELGKSN